MRAVPGGVSNRPFGFVRSIFSVRVSSEEGIMVRSSNGMKVFPVLISSGLAGGKYMGFPFGLYSFMIWSSVVRVDMVVELRRVALTYLTGLM